MNMEKIHSKTAGDTYRGEIFLSKGVDQLNRGYPTEALKLFHRALVIDPQDVLAAYNSGLACQSLGKTDLAVAFYQRAIQNMPGFAQAHHNLAQARASLQQPRLAADSYQSALQLNPEDFNSAFNLGLLYRELGDAGKAVDATLAAIHIAPDSAEAFNLLGLLFSDQHRFHEALVCLDQAMRIDPNLPQAHYNKGVVYQKIAQFERSLRHFQRAKACEPKYAPAHWMHQLSLPMIYDHPGEIDRYRQRFRSNLDRLVHSIPLATNAQKKYALQGIKTTTNFYLQYQCRDDLDLQKKYGNFVQRVMAANYPQWSQRKSMPSLAPGKKIRVGYVSTFMRQHTVGTFLSGWLESHDSSEFEIYGYSVGSRTDDLTHHLSSLCHRFHHFSGNLEAAARRIHGDNLHILVFTDIGMDPLTTLLAALRLAPVQCKGWGHPITTGLPTIDYYLSSDRMEPSDAQAYYSEKLIRLPNLALCYRRPLMPKDPKTRPQLGLPENRFIFLSTQSVFKYLPQHDDIYPLIAKEVPRACFAFIGHHCPDVTQRFRARLKAAFAEHGLDGDEFCFFSGKLKFDDFLSLNLAGDVLLDSLEWSGGKTTLEGISCGVPVVTLPGRFMRGRHAYAMLEMIGSTDTIARNKANYCDIAIRLANDPDFFRIMRTRTARNRHRLYGDHTFMDALEEFYKSVVPEARDELHKTTPHGVDPDSANRGVIDEHMAAARNHYKACRWSEVEKACQKVLHIDPDHGGALQLLGISANTQGRYKEACRRFRRALEAAPDQPELLNNLGATLDAMGRYHEAEELLRKALDLSPDYQDARSNLGLALFHLGRYPEAGRCFETVLTTDPRSGAALANLGMTRLAEQRYAQAATAYEKAIAIDSNQSRWHGNLGSAYVRLAEFSRASECFRRASRLETSNPDYAINRSIALRAMGKLSESIDILENLFSRDPYCSAALAQLVIGLEYTCQWEKLDLYHPLLDRATRDSLDNGRRPDEDPMLNIRRSDDLRINQAVSRAWSSCVRRKISRHTKKYSSTRPIRRDDRITLGYLSYDFRNHPVAHQSLPLFRLHDRRRFRVLGFSMGPDDGSSYRREIESNCDAFIDLGNTGLMDAVQMVGDRRVDILVDLMGHSHHNRLEILALRPAPLQVGYLGFLGTSGADFIDYLIADEIVVPEDHGRYYDEKIIRLPGCYQINHDYRLGIAESVHRKDWGLPENGFIFCSFNNAYKIDRTLFDIWMRILHRIPHAVLWLRDADPLAVEQMRARAEIAGIDPRRLIFSRKVSLPDHLKRLRLADLALDTLHYNGGATTANALAAGIPVLSVMGRHWVSRMSASHLHAAGLPELILRDSAEYECKAVELARNPAKLRALKHRLGQKRGDDSLFDPRRFVRNLESAYEAVWDRHRSGRPPADTAYSGKFWEFLHE